MKNTPLRNRKALFVGLFLLVLLGAAGWLFWPPRLDYGTVEKGVYHNAYFHLSLPVEGWNPTDMEEAKWRADVLREQKEPTSTMPKRPPAWKRPNIHLITLYDKPWGSREDFNASFFIFADRVNIQPGVRDAMGYLRTAQNTMLSQYPQGRASGPIEEVLVNGKKGARMRLEWEEGGNTFRQEYISFKRRGYFLSLVLTWFKSEERLRLQIPLDSVRFR